jgi:hypothetical protein
MIGSPMPVFLSKDATIEALPAQMSRIAVLAAVYDYWKSKLSEITGKSLSSITYRPREKAHQPQPDMFARIWDESEE